MSIKWNEGRDTRSDDKGTSNAKSYIEPRNVGELTIKFTATKPTINLRKLLKLKHNHSDGFNTPKTQD